MAKRFLSFLIGLVRRVMGPAEEDDDPRVRRVSSLDSVVGPGERILWEGTSSPRHAWGDHDQLEPVRQTPMQPTSVLGRVLVAAIVTVLILCFAGMGAALLVGALGALSRIRTPKSFFGVVVLVLLGLTMLAGLAFLLRPLANAWRARRIRYLITDRRALVVRQGPAWAEIWVRTPMTLCVSLLCLVGGGGGALATVVSGFERLFGDGSDLGNWSATLISGVVFVPLLLLFAIIGWVVLLHGLQIVVEAHRSRDLVFVRAFSYRAMAKHKYPKVERLRPDGPGDVVLGTGGYWETDVDSMSGGSMVVHQVGFLSVPDAEQVAERIRAAIDSQ